MSVRSTPSVGLARREPCAKCGMPVFLAERLNVGKSLYHRTCFTCARCNAQLSPGNCYETETEGQYCCETCPDEEKIGFFNENLEEESKHDDSIKNKLSLFEGKAGTYSSVPKNPLKLVESKDTLQRSLSDEEKSKSLNKRSESSDGASFHTALNDTYQSNLTVSSSSKAMSSFINQLTTSDEPPSLPDSEPPDSYSRYNSTPEISLTRNSKYFIDMSRSIESEPKEEDIVAVAVNLLDSTSSSSNLIEDVPPVLSVSDKTEEDSSDNIQVKPSTEEVPIVKDLNSSKSVNNKELDLVALRSKTKLSEVINNQRLSASAPISDAKIKTKDNEDEDKNNRISIVKSRMKMFESSTKSGSQNIEQIQNTQTPKIDKIMTTPEVPYSNTVDVLIPLTVERMSSSSEDDGIKTQKNEPQKTDNEQKSISINNTDVDLNSSQNEDLLNSIVFEEETEERKSTTLPSEVDSLPVKESQDKDNNGDLLNSSDLNTEVIEDEISVLPTVLNEDTKSKTPSTEDLMKKIDFDVACDIEDTSTDDKLPSTIDSDKTISHNLPLPKTEKNISTMPSDKFKSSPIILDETILRNLSTEDVSCVTINSSILADSSQNDSTVDYPEDLNPFGDEDDANVKQEGPQAPKRTQKSKPAQVVVADELKESTNPFGSDDDDENEDSDDVKVKPPRPPPPQVAGNTNTRRLIPAPKISLNPFWSDDEEESEEDQNVTKSDKPAPAPRTVKSTVLPPEPAPRSLQSNSCHGSTTSLMSDSSSTSGAPVTPHRKKKPAPKPPGPFGAVARGTDDAVSLPGNSLNVSPRATPRPRKARPAPAPPTSVFSNDNELYASATNLTPPVNTNIRTSSTPVHKNTITDSSEVKNLSPILTGVSASGCGEWEKRKNNKDENNRTRQSQTSSTLGLSPTAEISDNILAPNKSSNGRWKRKKGPAPLAVPPRRKIPLLALTDIKHELEDIEVQQQGLEKQGVKLEQMIREKCEGPNMTEDDPMPIEVDDLVLQLFELVNEKNELFRRQAELMYLRRQQRLEEEHAELEYQIRCLMAQPERNKTDSDKAREEMLISRLLEVVQRRNEVVECLEMDRLREAEEDHSISSRLELYAAKREEQVDNSPVKLSKKEKKKEKEKKKLKKGKKGPLDVDKDIDESETVVKDKKKKKWFAKE